MFFPVLLFFIISMTIVSRVYWLIYLRYRKTGKEKSAKVEVEVEVESEVESEVEANDGNESKDKNATAGENKQDRIKPGDPEAFFFYSMAVVMISLMALLIGIRFMQPPGKNIGVDLEGRRVYHKLSENFVLKAPSRW